MLIRPSTDWQFCTIRSAENLGRPPPLVPGTGPQRLMETTSHFGKSAERVCAGDDCTANVPPSKMNPQLIAMTPTTSNTLQTQKNFGATGVSMAPPDSIL